MLSRFCIKKIKGNLHEDTKTLLILGGFGYGNVGDEAQLSYCIKRLKSILPGFILRIMTPDIKYSYITHDGCNVDEAPRLSLFDADTDGMYGITHIKPKTWKSFIKHYLQKIRFVIRGKLIVLNAYLIKMDLLPLLLKARRISFLYQLKECSGVFYDGGGYLTGETLSRLWDSFYVISAAKILGKPVFISGQTIGLWNSAWTKRQAKKVFAKCDLIGCRDHKGSLKALHGLGLNGNQAMAVCDDALFLTNEMKFSDISRNFTNVQAKKYIALNIQTWGMSTDLEKENSTEKVIKIIQQTIDITGYDIVLVSMSPVDEEAINFVTERYQSEKLHVFPFEYDFKKIRAVYAYSKICVTMKHHPIIFSMGEKVPTIALYYDPYYLQKNQGALALFGQENNVVNIMEANYFDDYENKLRGLIENYDKVVNEIDKGLFNLKSLQNIFYSKIQRKLYYPEQKI